MAYVTFRTLKNCTSSMTSVPTDKYVADGSYFTILLYANDGYKFKSGTGRPKINYKSSVDYFTLNEDATEASYKINYMSGDAEVNATAYILDNVALTNDLHHATNSITSENLTTGSAYNFVITAESGYYFTTVPQLEYVQNGSTYYKNFTAVESETITQYTLYWTVPNDTTSVKIYASADVIPSEEIKERFGIIKLFNPTNEELEEISYTRYRPLTTNASEIIDLGQYISHLFKLFIHIPDYAKETVKLGGYDTAVESSVIQNDIVITDCGQIEIQGKYNNVMDYQNTEIEIYLPFAGFQNLEPSKVMNKKLKLIYKTSLINGETLVYINDEQDNIIYTFNCNVGYEVPYRTNGKAQDTPLNVSNGYLHGFLPFVNIRVNKEYNSAYSVGNDDRETIINQENGFISCSHIFNTIKTTLEEKEMIDNLLSSGIIV